MIEDADSDIILRDELLEYENRAIFENELKLIEISAVRVAQILEKCTLRSVKDNYLDRNTFYGKTYSTIDDQFLHILNVQNYYIGMIGEKIDLDSNICKMRLEMSKLLRRKYISDGNKIYKYESELWTIKKIVRRTIWHDRIHTKAIERMNVRIKTNRTIAST